MCLQPYMLRMARELEDEVGQITLHAHMIQEAAHGQHKLLLGQMAAAIHAATKHVFVPDIAVSHGGGMPLWCKCAADCCPELFLGDLFG
jgi:hypothetical protein